MYKHIHLSADADWHADIFIAHLDSFIAHLRPCTHLDSECLQKCLKIDRPQQIFIVPTFQ